MITTERSLYLVHREVKLSIRKIVKWKKCETSEEIPPEVLFDEKWF
jgi:hypothetical protein